MIRFEAKPCLGHRGYRENSMFSFGYAVVRRLRPATRPTPGRPSQAAAGDWDGDGLRQRGPPSLQVAAGIHASADRQELNAAV